MKTNYIHRLWQSRRYLKFHQMKNVSSLRVTHVKAIILQGRQAYEKEKPSGKRLFIHGKLFSQHALHAWESASDVTLILNKENTADTDRSLKIFQYIYWEVGVIHTVLLELDNIILFFFFFFWKGYVLSNDTLVA